MMISINTNDFSSQHDTIAIEAVGEEFWNSLNTGERLLVGECLRILLARDRLLLTSPIRCMPYDDYDQAGSPAGPY